MEFHIIKRARNTEARLGSFKTDHGGFKTPCFMPIATRGAVKNVDVQELSTLGAEIILGNTYHLFLKPGDDLILNAGGLHCFMNWKGPILTDSGGFQVYSLAKIRKIRDDGVEFQSHLDGSRHILTPEKSMDIQMRLGSDIMMCLDECLEGGATSRYIKNSVRLTTDWATRSWKYLQDTKPYHPHKQFLFGIVQGGRFKTLRRQSAEALTALPFHGFAIGGVSVGESRMSVQAIIEYTAPLLPWNKPRYLMGLGRPEEIIMAVKSGVDMFDCVIPTREARHGRLYQFCKSNESGAIPLFEAFFYKTIQISNEQYKKRL